MYIEFQGVRWKNLLMTGNDWVQVALNRHDLLLITGKNGTGKSTVIDAICFALYGKPYRKVNKSQLVNSINKKDLLVECAFKIGSNQYVVRRGIKPNVFEIYKNKQLIPEDSSTADYQSMLEKTILCVNMKTFCQVNILGSANYTEFMELEAKDRRVVVEDLLDSHVFSVMQTLAKTEAKQLATDMQSEKAAQSMVAFKIEQHKLLLERQAEDAKANLQRVDDQLNEHQEAFMLIEKQINELNKKVATFTAKRDSVIADPKKVQDARDQLNSVISGNNALINKLKSETARLEHLEHCSVCQQAVSADHKAKIAHTTAEQIAELDKQNKIAVGRLDKVNTLLAEYQPIVAAIADLKQQVDLLVSHRSQRSTLISQLTAQRTEIEEAASKRVDVDEQEIVKLTNQLQTHEHKIDDQTEQLTILKSCVDLLSDDGIKAQIVSKYIPVINQTINQFLEKMDLFAEFELDDQFNETIKSRHRDKFSYNSFSQGQKMRIDLAILFTWREIAKIRNSVSSNLLIMDEVLDRSLDPEGSTDFLRILKELSADHNALVISHNPDITNQFDNCIQVVANGNFTEYQF